MNFRYTLFAAVTVFQCAMTVAEFSPVQWNAHPSGQCGEYTNPDLTGVLATLTQMIHSNISYGTLPKSCMEIKESSPASPSGYYTLSSGTSGNASVVYCNMEDLYSCPALGQALSGIMKDLLSLSTGTDSCPALEQTLDEIRNDVDSLFTDINSPLFSHLALGSKGEVSTV